MRPDEDIEIKITGCRRGERLIEKLHDDNETIGPTSHPSISSVTPRADFEPEELFDSLRLLERTCADANGYATVKLLERLLLASGVRCDLDLNSSLDVTMSDEQLVMPIPTGDADAPRDSHAAPA